VLNRVAKSVVESVRGLHPMYVFVHAISKDNDPRPLAKIYNTAWKSARERAADESFEDRQDLLGHRCGRITTHYSPSRTDELSIQGPPGIHASLSVALPRVAVMIGSRNVAIRTTTSLSCAGAALSPLFPKKPFHCDGGCDGRARSKPDVEVECRSYES